MTLIFQNNELMGDIATPRMHVLVLGIGRFPHLDNAPNGDRPACPDSARAMIEFLVRQSHGFEAPLATIDCLISDPRNEVDHDIVERTHPIHDPRLDDLVAPGLRQNVENVCYEWMDRARERDVLLLYCCSHGLAGLDDRGLLVCEDYNERRTNKPAYLLNVSSMAKALPAAIKASAVWIFMDACQEVLDELLLLEGGVGGIQPARADVMEQVRWRVKSTAIVAAPFGEFAKAPHAGGLAYFTETLLHGIGKCCVESKDGGWIVTSGQLLTNLDQLSHVKHGRTLSTSLLCVPQGNHRLMKVDVPEIPVAISTRPEVIMETASQVEIKTRQPGAISIMTKDNGDATWRCDIELDERLFEVFLMHDDEGQIQREFHLDPPSVLVRIEE